MPGPLDELSSQHRQAEFLLLDLRHASNHLETDTLGSPNPWTTVSPMCQALQSELASHFLQEEDGLFPVLGRHIGQDDGPLALLCEHHRSLRSLAAELCQTASTEATGLGRATRFCSTLDQFTSLLHQHIEVEDTVLLPMATELLNQAEMDEIADACRHLGSADPGGADRN